MATPYPPLLISDLDAPPPGAEASCADPAAETTRCDACDAPITGEPAGEGLYLWSRGGELIYEPAPLCENCALAVSASANADAGAEEEDGLSVPARGAARHARAGCACLWSSPSAAPQAKPGLPQGPHSATTKGKRNPL